ncbi:hypothetical protein PV327_007046 [Microctonus hyperodae]|uniref:Uncharacterized protein n=1 Tax=Microctonus hyperodae TaxID=165561 RepID=A0AA39F5M3_MICHY|nr:hypothetical protein PV327_007046 [Microctonus hyperodae]
MAMIWQLGKINVAKQFYYGVKLLPHKNSTIPNVIQRLKSEISIKKRPAVYRSPTKSLNKISKAVMKYQRLDKVSEGFQIIYMSPLTRMIKLSYHASYIFIILCIFGIYYTEKVIDYDGTFSFINKNLNRDSPIMTQDANEVKLMLGGTILFNCSLLLLTRMHVVRIWFSPEKNLYKLVITGDLPIFKKSIEFSSKDVKMKPRNLWRSLTYVIHYIKGKRYFIAEENFKVPADYQKLVGDTLTH